MFSMEKLLEKARRGSRRWPLGLLAVALVLSGTAVADSTTATKSPSAPPYKANPMTKLKLAVLEMPLSFELNRGQTDAKVKFLTQAQNFTVFLTPGETILRGRNADVLRMRLQNANQSPKLVGEQRQAKVTNYYIGNDRSKWLEGVPNYGQVRFQNVYSGIDMVYHSDQRKLEYDFVVNPGADANQIGVVFDGASSVRINEQGELELKSEGGTSVNHKPVVYQTIDGKRKAIDGSFTLSANNVVGFKLGQYDHTQPLVIDPTLQVLSFFGGNLNDEASGIATSAVQPSLSAAGVVFVGRSESATLPGVGGTKPSPGINWDAFATGLGSGTPGVPASGGTAILWTTYFGGLGDDAARGVAMDNQGNAYVVGYTASSNFPAGTAVQYDAFIVKIAAAGGAITGSTLYGGPGVDQGTSIALDFSTFSTLPNAVAITNPATDPQVTPNVVIGGFTTGSIGAAGSPAASAGKTPRNGFSNCTATGAAAAGCGTNDGFVAYFSNALAVQNAVYIGGGGNDQVNGVAVDVWGNVYATGFATPAVAPNFPVTRGIAQTSLRAGWDAAQGPLGSAVAFVAKWACTTGTPPIGVPSPPPAMPACGGTNNLGTMANSALFGGSANGGYNVGGTITPAGSFINPQQMAIITPVGGVPPTAGSNINGITEAGMAIAVDQNGWGQQGVAGIAPSGFINAAGFPDIVPNSESTAACNLAANGNNGIPAPRCAVSATNSATTGGFEPGLSGPHVYVAGMTASRDFVNSLVVNASCRVAPFVSSTAVPALCPVPEVWGGAVTAAGATPTPRCDTVDGNGVCPAGLPAGVIQDIRIKTIGGTIGGSTFNFNAGQTQGWLASFQFPAVTQEVVQPPLTTSTTTVTSLNPPTVPNYVILQPATCPPQLAGCIEGGTNPAIPALPFVAANFPAPNYGCVAFGVPTPTGVTCPTPFFGSWNAVAVDSDQQVYVIGQIGMSGTTGAGGGFGVFGTGAPNRLALELERIQPYANTPGGNVSAVFPNFCPGPANAPCAFPELQFPFSGTVPGGSTTSLLVDNFPGAGGGAGGPGSILNSNFGQILPGAPPFPNPNQPGGLGNGIAVSATREAFFVGTTTVLTVPGAAPPTATATADLDGANHVLDIVVTGAGAGYTTLPTCTITGGGGTGATCSLAAGGFTLSGAGSITGGPGIGNPCPACITAGGTGYTAVPVVTLSAPPAAATSALTYINATPLVAPSLPVPPTQGNLTGGAGTSSNAGESCAGPPCAGNGPEDVIYGAVQFYDAIAQPTAINFTATVNNFNSLTGPNGQTGLNAKAFVNYTNWEGQPLNVPPGCIVTPVVPSAATSGGTFPIFNVTATGTSSFQVTVNATAATLNALAVPGVFTQMVVFSKSDACSGVGFPPGLDSWDPLTLTLTVSAPLNLSPENTLGTTFAPITSKLATGIVDQYLASGVQLVANQTVAFNVDVTTAISNGPINFTAQIVPGQNWSGSVTGAVLIPTPTDIIYTAAGPNGGQTLVPVRVNTQVLAGLPLGTYTAFIMFAASPETPALPTSGSTACGPQGGATAFPTTPVGSGTTSPACIPIVIQITPGVIANTPGAVVFGVLGNSGTPQQTQVLVSNPTNAPYTFTGGYVATPVFGTALPSANVSFAGTATTCPSSIGSTVGGTIAPGGICTIPIQVTPAGLKTGIYSGQVLISNNGQASGATPQTSVPLIVYVGPNTGTTGEDAPSGNGLGLMLPINVPPVGIGTVASVGSAPGSPGSYPLTISVPSGVGPNGINQIPNPTLIQVTGLNNVSTTPFTVNAPTTTLAGVSFTNVGNGFGGAVSSCSPTYASLAALPGSPLGPPCVWSLWVDATSLNSTNTVPNAAACGVNPGTGLANLGESGTVSFSGGGFPMATLVVPLTVCVTDSPSLTLGMPNTFPNPTFGPSTGTGFGNCNSGGVACLLAQPSNLIPGFPQSIVDMVLAASGGGTLGSTAAPINLLTSAGNSSEVCKVLDLRTNGGIVTNVTIAPSAVQWLTINQAPAVFLGPPVGAPNSLQFNSGTPFTNNWGVFGLGGLAGSVGIPGTPPFSAGPFMATPAMQTFQICVNTDPVGNVAGTFSTTVTINGAGVGAITVPVNMVIANGSVNTPPPPVNLSQIGVFRNTTSGPNAGLGQWWLAGPSNAFDASTKGPRWFGLNGDIAVTGDWDGSGVVRLGVFRCPASGVCQWYIDLNNNGQWDGTFGGDAIWNFGLTGDLPVVGDWTGTGGSKIGVMRCGTTGVCTWYLDLGNKHTYDPATVGTYSFGLPGDKPVAGPWANISGVNAPVDQIGVFRCPASGVCQWFVDSTGQTGTASTTPLPVTATSVYSFGLPGDLPVVGTWNNNGGKRIGVFRSVGGLGVWFVDTNGNHAFDPGTDQMFNFGLAGDQPVTGFWTLP